MARPHLLSYLFIQHVLGSLSVPSQNVVLSSKNFSFFLTWTPTEEYPPETSYEVEIKLKGIWLPLTICTAPTGEGCDITCTIDWCYSIYQARVRSILPGLPSVWSISNPFSPFDDVELGAPEVKVVFREETIMVHLQINLSTCNEKILKACLLQQLSYEVEFWDADERVRRPIKQSLSASTMEIRQGELRGSNNCISARSVFTSTAKLSNFSKPVCFSLKQKGLQAGVYLAILGSLLGGLFLISIVVAIVKKIIYDPSKLKMPAALDFSKNLRFTQMMADDGPDVCKLSIIVHCEKIEDDLHEQKMALERHLLRGEMESSVSDCTDESDEENECSDYTDSRWIPDGMIFDEDDIQQQLPNIETYQKANCFFDSCIGAVDLRSQDSDCTDHSRPQTKPYTDVSSFTSVVLNSEHFTDSINCVVPQRDEKISHDDIPLKSVKILTDDDDDVRDKDVNLLPDVPLLACDLNCPSNAACDPTYSHPTLLPGEWQAAA
uniref:interferon lambda receptor 1-like n=1 Tax=Pristiophorus japonicus TaxID=55135 RepID=UPI00398ECFCE